MTCKVTTLGELHQDSANRNKLFYLLSSRILFTLDAVNPVFDIYWIKQCNSDYRTECTHDTKIIMWCGLRLVS